MSQVGKIKNSPKANPSFDKPHLFPPEAESLPITRSNTLPLFIAEALKNRGNISSADESLELHMYLLHVPVFSSWSSMLTNLIHKCVALETIFLLTGS